MIARRQTQYLHLAPTLTTGIVLLVVGIGLAVVKLWLGGAMIVLWALPTLISDARHRRRYFEVRRVLGVPEGRQAIVYEGGHPELPTRCAACVLPGDDEVVLSTEHGRLSIARKDILSLSLHANVQHVSVQTNEFSQGVALAQGRYVPTQTRLKKIDESKTYLLINYQGTQVQLVFKGGLDTQNEIALGLAKSSADNGLEELDRSSGRSQHTDPTPWIALGLAVVVVVVGYLWKNSPALTNADQSRTTGSPTANTPTSERGITTQADEVRGAPPLIYAGVRLGMSQEATRRLLGEPNRIERSSSFTTYAYRGVEFEFNSEEDSDVEQRGRLHMIVVDDPAFRTPEGIGIGSTEAEVRKRVPSVKCATSYGRRSCEVGDDCYQRQTGFHFFKTRTVKRITHHAAMPCE